MQTASQTQARIKNAQRALAKANANGRCAMFRCSDIGSPFAGCNGRSQLSAGRRPRAQFPLYGCPLAIHLAGKHLHWPFSVNIDRFPCKFNTQTFRAGP